MLSRIVYPRLSSKFGSTTRRALSFSFAGPRNLDDIIKKDMVADKDSEELTAIWNQYHEGKEGVLGLKLKGSDGIKVLSRAKTCPFFVQPVFRESGFFMLVSQFMSPTHFLLAYLEDYKMDPHSATPLLTYSVFDDYAVDKDLALIRCDILNKGLGEEEAKQIVTSLLTNYANDKDYPSVEAFNKSPDSFDIDDFISRMNDRWKQSS